MSKTIKVALTGDHLRTIGTTKPIAALEELIWNSLDADASHISVLFQENELGAVDKISIVDDGHGIRYQDIDSTFGKIGDSIKRKRFSPSGRLYHGKLGFGRYKVYSLGNQATWISTIKDNGDYSSFSISGENSNRKLYIVSEIEKNGKDQTGVELTIDQIVKESININSDIVKREILRKFASYLLANPKIKINFSREYLDPISLIEAKEDRSINVKHEEDEIAANIQIIRWNYHMKSEIFWCAEGGITYKVDEIRKRRGTNISCYVKSKYFEDAYSQNRIDILSMDQIFKILQKEVYDYINEYIRRESAKIVKDTIDNLRTKEIYPYKGDSTSSVEQYEREVFDVCASHIYEYIPGFEDSPHKTQQMTLNLVKEAIEQNPRSLKKILGEVLELSNEEKDKFAEVLDEIKLTSMINLSRLVSDRINTLNGFESLLFQTEELKTFKERSQLHKILDKEAWIFGEEWVIGASDRKLRTILKEHKKILGDSIEDDILDHDAINGLEQIPDLFFYRTTGDHDPNTFHHLIVELKRPSIKIGKNEIDQIVNYALTVSRTPAFDKSKTDWTFVLVNNELDDFAIEATTQQDRPKGLYHVSKDGKIHVWIRTWSEILQPIHGKLKYLKEEIEFQENSEKDIQYIKSKYPHLFGS